MAYETLIVETEDHVTLIKLNRPEALNALNAQLLGELAEALKSAEENEKVRCIVITGSEKAFAAGADISEMAGKSFVDMFMSDYFGEEVAQLLKMRKPVIAAVAGYALGGGCELAMMCDFIIAADTAKFGQPEINLGVVAGIGGTVIFALQRRPTCITCQTRNERGVAPTRTAQAEVTFDNTTTCQTARWINNRKSGLNSQRLHHIT